MLFALVVAGVVALYRARRNGIAPGAATLLALAGPTALAVLAERRWTSAIVGSSIDTLRLRESESSASYLGGRLSGAWHELFNAHYSDTASMVPVLLAVGLVVGLGYLALRQWRPRSRQDLVLITVVVVGAVVARMVLFPDDTVTGLFAAWPLGLLGVLLLRRAPG